jgi:hypothetical protein
MADNKFDAFLDLALAHYNDGLSTPVTKSDTYFKSFVIGMLSSMVSDPSLDAVISYLEKKVAS